MRFSTCLALVFAGGCAASPATHSAPMAHRAAEKVGVPGRCEDPVPAGGNAEGCYWNASVELGPHGTELFWQIDRYPDVSSALAAETAQSVVVAFGGRVFLETVTGSASWSGHGEHLATVGPLVVPADVELTARFMQATSSIDEATLPHVHPGPEGFFQVDGSVCVETSAGVHRVAPGTGAVLPAGIFMQLHATSEGVRRSLVLVIHPTGQAWINRHTPWTPKGGC